MRVKIVRGRVYRERERDEREIESVCGERSVF